MTTDRCTGHCCQNFYMPLSPDELERGYRRWSTDGGTQIQMNGKRDSPIYRDIHLIAPMVVYLGPDAKMSRCVNPTDETLLGKPELPSHRYRCKHFDPKAKVCTIYDIRPAMCRDYPGEDWPNASIEKRATCNYAGCTWKARKAKRETKAQLRDRLKALQPVEKEPTTKAKKT